MLLIARTESGLFPARVLVAAIALLVMSCGSADDSARNRLALNPTPADLKKDAKVVELIDAIDAGNTTLAVKLLEEGVDPNGVLHRPSPLVAAIYQTDGKHRKFMCDPVLVEALLRHGANPNRLEPPTEDPPLFSALGTGNPDCAKLLVAHGARPDFMPSNGNTFLEAAAIGVMNSGDKSVARLPIDWGIDPNIVSNLTGSNALFTAVLHRSEIALHALLELPVNHCIRDHGGQTALDYARMVKWEAGVRVLEDAGSCSGDS